MAAAGWTLYVLVFLLSAIGVHGDVFVNVTVLQTAVQKGAVCLDGSPPSYGFFEGSGKGITNWMVFLEGGGWCNSEGTCMGRSHSGLGSSVVDPKENLLFNGILDNDCTLNPDFCTWNKVYVRYCDGSSFLSNVEEINPKNNLTFRGARIFICIVEEMLARGMVAAENAILTGSSAGGLATIFHCDEFKAFLPDTKRVKCISDSGFFIRGESLPGLQKREIDFSQAVVETHKLANNLPASCTSQRDPNLCLFPEYLIDDIETPLFLIESAYDQYQVQDHFFKGIYYGSEWQNCTHNLSSCDATMASLFKDFGRTFIETVMKLEDRPSIGMFVHSCFRHTHIVGLGDGWTCSVLVGNMLAQKTIGQAVGDWYFDRSCFSEIDTYTKGPLNCSTSLSYASFTDSCRAYLHKS